MKDKITEHSTPDSVAAKVDSIVVVPKEKVITTAPSLFKNNLLVRTQKYPQLHITRYDYTISSILLVLFVFFVWLYSSNFKIISQVIRDAFQFRGVKQSRENAIIGNRASVFLLVFFVINLSILIGRMLDYYGIVLISTRFPDEIIFGILIIAIYSIKLMIIKLSGFIFKLQNEASGYVHQVISYCDSLGLFLLPVIILLSFFKQASPIIFINMGVILVLVFLLIRIVNGIVFGLNSSKISKFYLFIYLCALEILPLIIIARLIILRIN